MTDEQPSAYTLSPSDGWFRVWIPRLTIGTLAVLTLFFGTVWVFTRTRSFLLNIVIAIFVAFALLPAVEMLARRGWRRGPATAVVMLAFALIAGTFAAAMTQVVVDQVINLVDRAPEYIRQTSDWVSETFGYELDVDRVIEDLTADEERLNQLALNAADGILGVASTALGMLFQALTIGLFVFYILADLPRLRTTVLRRFPPTSQATIDSVTTITIDKVGGYVYSRALLAGASAAFHFVVFLALGLPYAFALALWVGIVSQFIPTIGTYLAGFVPVLIALLEGGLWSVAWVVVAITVYQQIENYLLSPKITANTMDLHPAVAFGSAIVGASLLGGIGALLAIPFAAVVTALISTYADHYDVVSTSGPIGSTEELEDRMRARAQEKAERKAARMGRWRTLVPKKEGG